MTDFPSLLEALVGGAVEFVIIGGVAATAHGSAHVTVDLDIVYRRTPENIARLATALAPHQPYLRGAPPGLPFRFDAETIQRGLNLRAEGGDQLAVDGRERRRPVLVLGHLETAVRSPLSMVRTSAMTRRGASRARLPRRPRGVPPLRR